MYIAAQRSGKGLAPPREASAEKNETLAGLREKRICGIASLRQTYLAASVTDQIGKILVWVG
jgi:hypothetical protein